MFTLLYVVWHRWDLTLKLSHFWHCFQLGFDLIVFLLNNNFFLFAWWIISFQLNVVKFLSFSINTNFWNIWCIHTLLGFFYPFPGDFLGSESVFFCSPRGSDPVKVFLSETDPYRQFILEWIVRRGSNCTLLFCLEWTHCLWQGQ